MADDSVRVRAGRAAAPAAIDVGAIELVSWATLAADIPLAVVRPLVPDVDLAEWIAASRAEVEARLAAGGAILFRGFPVDSTAAFERVARAVCPALHAGYGDLPAEPDTDGIYAATPYPPDQTILFHNEGSHTPMWPMKQMFYCALAAPRGGETPIADCREVYRRLEPDVREKFADKGLRYVRNFTDGLDVSWREFFKTDDRAAVEERCRRDGVECHWTAGGVRIEQRCPAVVRHPRTGEPLFFNQIQLHHPATLDPALRAALLATFGEARLPRNVYFGDGSVIPDRTVTAIVDLYWSVAVMFMWERGDILLVDNMLMAHARRPYAGPRKVAVALGDMMSAEPGRA